MKSKNAFALKELYALIKPTPKSPERANFDAEQFQYYFLRHYQNEYIPLDSVVGAIALLDRDEYSIKQVNLFISRIKNHIRRLEKIDVKPMSCYLRKGELLTAYKSLLSSTVILLDGLNRQFDGGLDYIKTLTGETFRQRLRTARKWKGITGNNLAEFLRISQKSFSQYETGRAAPSMPTLVILAKKLNVSLDWLLGLQD